MEMIILRLMTLTSTIIGMTGFTILNNTVSWQDANRSCTLATPVITFNRNGMSIDIDPTSINENGEYWVGYTSVTKLFAYKGRSCESSVAKLSIRNFTIYDGLPGLCYSACNTSSIGIKEKICYCFQDSQNVDDEEQSVGIKHCVGPESVSLYDVANVSLETEIGTAEEGCVASDRKDKTLKLMKDCNRHLKIMCQTRKNPDSTDISSEAYPWNNFGDYCFSKSKEHGSQTEKLKLSGKGKTESESEGLFWKGLFLSGSVFRKIGEPGTPMRFGSVSKSGDKLKFSSRNGNETKRAVCKDEHQHQGTTSAGPSSTMSTTAIIGPTNEDKKSSDANKSKYTRNNQILLYVLVPVITCIVIAAAVAAVFRYRKRAKPKSSRQNPTLSSENSQVEDAHGDTDYSYAVSMDTLESTQRQQSNPNDDGVYDVSGATGRARNVGNHTESKNVYCKLNILSDDTYDHTDFKKIPGNVLSGKTLRGIDDVTYSTSQTRDDSYDTALPKQNGLMVTQNVYSHANKYETYSQTNRITKSKSSATDNVYN